MHETSPALAAYLIEARDMGVAHQSHPFIFSSLPASRTAYTITSLSLISNIPQ